MKTTEIISAFLKGSTIATISDKQRSWLISQAKKESIPVRFDGTSVYLEKCFYMIRQCMRMVSCGSYGSKAPVYGKHIIERFYAIKFTDTGYQTIYNDADMDRIKREGYQFEIIKNFKEGV